MRFHWFMISLSLSLYIYIYNTGTIYLYDIWARCIYEEASFVINKNEAHGTHGVHGATPPLGGGWVRVRFQDLQETDFGPMFPPSPMGPMGPHPQETLGVGAHPQDTHVSLGWPPTYPLEGRVSHRGDPPEGATTETETTTHRPTPTTPHAPAPRDEIRRSRHPTPSI